MPQIETVLNKAGTSPTSFTLHDAGHSFRVAERMTKIIPLNVMKRLSSYELALLLMSAYLHDIGMTPEERKVRLHYDYLTTGVSKDLLAKDIEMFQGWLDEEGYEITPPISKASPTPEDNRLANEILTYYCRFRHNDWSEEWIVKNLSKEKMGHYVDWVDDLVALCRSHHDSYHVLSSARFNPRPVGGASEIVHLRYLACLLRIADILEFDPERTPDVILGQRDIPQGSLIYWWKDKQISLKQEGGRLVVTARPPSARLHRAIETMADEIDTELRLCTSLADETDFGHCPGLHRPLPHHWKMHSTIFRDIKPKDGVYEYIDGGFRPDTHKVLKLLSGKELYGSELVAVRELLQNSFDAVKEQIAYQRLTSGKPTDANVLAHLQTLQRVELWLETRDDGTWLICSDTGVGMTKAIINSHLLVSGRARRREILSLERDCKRAGFVLGRTGEFGIGVLSYFMIANAARIRTRRSQEAGNAEANGWSFHTEGISSFGELQADMTTARGTEVSLRLRPEVIGNDIETWYLSLKRYLDNTLVRIPCHFELRPLSPTGEGIRYAPGWTRNENSFNAAIRQELVPTPNKWLLSRETPRELLSEERRAEIKAVEQQKEEIAQEALSALKWDSHEGDLPNGLGRYRIHIPYFQLAGGLSLAFLRVQSSETGLSVDLIGKGQCFLPRCGISFSWKGMSAGMDNDLSSDQIRAAVEVDWNSAQSGSISINRSWVQSSEAGEKALKWVADEAKRLRGALAKANLESVYATLNYGLISVAPRKEDPVRWISARSERGHFTWDEVKFPIISSCAFIYHQIPQKMTLKGERVSVMRCIGEHADDEHYKGISVCSEKWPPDKLIGVQTPLGRVTPLWEGQSTVKQPVSPVGPSCEFPPAWYDVVAAEMVRFPPNRFHLWNTAHDLVKMCSSTGWVWLDANLKNSRDPLPYKAELLESPDRAAAWVLTCLHKGEWELWDGLKDRDSTFLLSIWEIIFGKAHKHINEFYAVKVWLEASYESCLYIVTPLGWRAQKNKEKLAELLPNPGPDWTLVVEAPT